MIKIVVATKNEHKVKELREMLNLPDIEVSTMSDLGIDIDIVEDGSTFEENALKKARELYKYINDKNITVIADDSGLCVDYLNGAPGIYSARYSGGGYSENNSKLLNELKDVPMDKRSAHFSCVIALINQKEEKIFAGTCNGFIALEEKGDNKFGYDPIFLFPETGMTFGEMTSEDKNKISHRASAVMKLKKYLSEMC